MSSLPAQPQRDDTAKDAEAKKPYEAPVLVRWGTLHDVTRAVGATGAADGGKKGPTRTAL
jgi:hypothetical protein